MRARIDRKNNGLWLTAALGLVLSVLGVLYFGLTGTKWVALLAGIGVIALLVTGDRKRLWNLPSLLLLGYAAFSWLTIFWAMSGKFHLRESSKLLVAVFFFLLVVLRKRFDGAFARRVMGMITGISALYAALSVEAATTGITKALLGRIPAIDPESMVFQSSRLNGIFGNANIEASIYAVGIFCALALVCGAEGRWQRMLFTIALSFNAFGFLLVFSMGAMACFALAVAVYLILAGGDRGAALMRMLGAAVPTVVCALLAYRLYGSGNLAALLWLMLANAAAAVLLEFSLAVKLSAVLEKHQRATLIAVGGAAVCAAVYAVAALSMTGPYTFGEQIIRSVSLSPGEHTVQIEADEGVQAHIYSQNRMEIIASVGNSLYNDAVGSETITIGVPEDAEVVFFSLWAQQGATVSRVLIDGEIELPLNYTLLPGFAANRLQTMGASSSPILRKMFREDAVKLWQLSPIVGNGVGAFETGVTAVQDYPYETRYVHNHYLQVLLEGGVIGFALFVGALLTMLLALWKKRGQMLEGEYRWVYPALCAEFVMNGGQMLWDVSMSMIVFLCMTYALYGLIVGICAEPLVRKTAEPEAAEGKKKKSAARKKPDASLLARNFGIGFTTVVVLTLCGNLYGDLKVSTPVADVSGFMENLRAAARLDLYEKNDKTLSYVLTSLEEDAQPHREQADEYAAQLAKVQSNSIPRYLVSYYLQTQQYAEAIDEAILGATYSASNAETWNSCAELLDQVLMQNMFSPLLTEERAALMAKLTEYYDALQSYNASALRPLVLSAEAQAFFDKIAALKDSPDDDTRFTEIMFGD